MEDTTRDANSEAPSPFFFLKQHNGIIELNNRPFLLSIYILLVILAGNMIGLLEAVFGNGEDLAFFAVANFVLISILASCYLKVAKVKKISIDTDGVNALPGQYKISRNSIEYMRIVENHSRKKILEIKLNTPRFIPVFGFWCLGKSAKILVE